MKKITNQELKKNIPYYFLYILAINLLSITFFASGTELANQTALEATLLPEDSLDEIFVKMRQTIDAHEIELSQTINDTFALLVKSPYICAQCTRKYTKYENLQNHILSHNQIVWKNYIACNKPLRRKNNLIQGKSANAQPKKLTWIVQKIKK